MERVKIESLLGAHQQHKPKFSMKSKLIVHIGFDAKTLYIILMSSLSLAIRQLIEACLVPNCRAFMPMFTAFCRKPRKQANRAQSRAFKWPGLLITP
jgi:hypothetical protein